MRRPRPTRLAALMGTLIVVALASGCGRTEHVKADGTLAVGLTEYRLNPTRARAHPGALTIVVHNYGLLSHNLVIARDGHPAGSTHAIAPGQSAVIVLELTRGTYTMSSTMLSDAALGARGTLTIR